MGHIFKATMGFVLLLLCSPYSIGQDGVAPTYEEIRISIAKHYVEVGILKSMEDFNADSDRFHFRGFYNEITNKDSIPDGIYRNTSNSSHALYFYILVDGSNFKILDLYPYDELYKSIPEILDFSIRKDYCKELTLEYIEGALFWHYYMSRYFKGNNYCSYDFDNSHAISELSLEEVRNKLLGLLKSDAIFKDDGPEMVLLGKVDEFDMDLDLSSDRNIESKEINIGFYRGSALNYAVDGEKVKRFYLLVGDTEIELLPNESEEKLNHMLRSFLRFSKEQRFCFKRVQYVIMDYLKSNLPGDSCLNELRNKMP